MSKFLLYVLFSSLVQAQFEWSLDKSTGEKTEGLFKFIPSAPKELQIENQGEVYYSGEKKELVYKEQVSLKGDSGIQFYAEEVALNTEKNSVQASKDLTVYNGAILSHGEQAYYNYKTKQLILQGVRAGYSPFMIEAEHLATELRNGKPVMVAKEASITTDNYSDPSFWVKAGRFELHPNELAVFHDLSLQIGERTLLKLPYLAQSFDRERGLFFAPGGQSNLGAFLKTRYGMYLGGEQNGTGEGVDHNYLFNAHVDLYSRRGVGVGASWEDLRLQEDSELGTYAVYGIYDLNPKIRRTQVARDGLLNNGRYQLDIKDRRVWLEREKLGLRLDTQLTLLSDQFMLEDYYEDRYRYDHQPDNSIALSHITEKWNVSLWSRFQLNSFYESDVRFPELVADRVRAPALDLPLLYESQSRVGYLSQSLADSEKKTLREEALTATSDRFEEISNALDGDGFFRAHTWHEWSYPVIVGQRIQVVPRVGMGYTYYNGQSASFSDGRLLSHVGLDASVKLSRRYNEWKWESLGLNSLTHTIQPYASISALEVSELKSDLVAVDRNTPITRPRPIHVGRYSAIDELDDWALLRAGVRQYFVTQRNEEDHQWLYWDTYLDFLLGERDTVNSFSNLYNELTWAPLPWFHLNLEAQFPVANSANDFTELFLNSRFSASASTEFEIGYGYLKNHPVVTDTNQLQASLFHRINEEWSIEMEHRWQFDDNTLELQNYAVHRNLRSWIFSGEVFIRDFRVNKEWGVTLGFTLRDFPELSLPLSLEQ